MKRLTHALVLLLIVCLTGCGSLNFQDFSAPDGSYTVKMPGTPVRSSAAGMGGEAWEVLHSNWSFAVASAQLPFSIGTLSPDRLNASLDGGVNGMVGALRATNQGSSPITLNGFPGREVQMSLPAGPNPQSGKQEPASTALARIYIVNSKFFIVMVRCTSAITKDTADVKTFFDSFKLNATASPGGVSMPGSSGGMPPPPSFTGNNPGGANPAAGSPGYPVAGNPPGMYPPPGGNTSAPPGSYPTPPTTYPNPNGTTPMPNGTSPSPTTYPPSNYTNPNGVNPTTTGNLPMPNGNYGQPPATAPQKGGFTPPTSQNSEPEFTGTPVTDETKIRVGDLLQAYTDDQWVDVKVQQVAPNGPVQVRTQTKPFVVDVFPRAKLQFPPGADTPEAIADVNPDNEPSGLPNSKGTGLPNSKSSGFKPPKSTGFANADPDKPSKPRPSGFGNPSSGSSKPSTKPDTGSSKPSLGAISVESASVEELLQMIAKKTEHRRVQAAEKLRTHSEAGPNPQVAKKLVELLQADQVTVRIAVAQALEKWACPEIYAAVSKNLTGGTSEVRQSMMHIAVANNIEGTTPAIVKCLIDADDRKVATESVLAIGAPAEPDVIKLLDHRDAKVRQAAREILEQIGGADSITALTKYAEKWTGSERIAARKIIKTLEAKK